MGTRIGRKLKKEEWKKRGERNENVTRHVDPPVGNRKKLKQTKPVG